MSKSKHSSNNNFEEGLRPLACPQRLVEIKKPITQNEERKKSTLGKRKALELQRMENLGNLYLTSDNEGVGVSIKEFESAEIEEQIEERGEESFSGLELLSLASIILSQKARNAPITQPVEFQDSELPSSDIQEDDHLDNPHIIELEKAKNEEINKLEREKKDRISGIDAAKEKIINFYTLKGKRLVSQSSLAEINIEKKFISKQRQYQANLIQQKHQITEEYIDIEEKLNAEFEKSQKTREDEIKSLNLEEIKFNEEFNKDHSEIIKKIEENQISITKAEDRDFSWLRDEADKIKNSYQEEIDKVEANYLLEVKNIEESYQKEEISLVKEITKIITDEETINFFKEKGVYESIRSLDSSFLKTNSDSKFDHISDDDLRVFAGKLSIAEGDFDFFTRILKGRKDFINENLGKREEEKIWDFFYKILRKNKVFGIKTNQSDLLKIFIDSNLSFKGKFDKIINRVFHYRNPGLLNKLIKDDPEYFKKNKDKIYDFFNRLVSQDAPKMALSIFLATGGWDINKKDKNGNTALHLISNKLNFSKNKGTGAAAVKVVSLRSQNVMVNALLLLGADPRITNAEGQLPGYNLTHPLFNKINTLLREYCDKKNFIEDRSEESGRRFDNFAQALLSLPKESEVLGESGEGIDGGSGRGGGGEGGEAGEAGGEGGQGCHMEKPKQAKDLKFYGQENRRSKSLKSSLDKRNFRTCDLRKKINSLELNSVQIILEKFKDNLKKLEGNKKEIENKKSVFDDKMREKRSLASVNWKEYEDLFKRQKNIEITNLREKAKKKN